MTNDPTPAEALAVIRESRAAMVRNLDYPLGYDLMYGLIVAAMVGSQALPTPWPILVIAPSIAGLVWMMRWWRNRFGFWVNGYAPPRARWVAYGLAAVMLGLMGLSFYSRSQGPWWWALVSAGLAFVVAIVASRLWMRVYRRELTEERA